MGNNFFTYIKSERTGHRSRRGFHRCGVYASISTCLWYVLGPAACICHDDLDVGGIWATRRDLWFACGLSLVLTKHPKPAAMHVTCEMQDVVHMHHGPSHEYVSFLRAVRSPSHDHSHHLVAPITCGSLQYAAHDSMGKLLHRHHQLAGRQKAFSSGTSWCTHWPLRRAFIRKATIRTVAYHPSREIRSCEQPREKYKTLWAAPCQLLNPKSKGKATPFNDVHEALHGASVVYSSAARLAYPCYARRARKH